jgi:hypothetical protein
MPSTSASAFGRRVIELRSSHWPGTTVTQKQVAEALDVSAASVSTWESRGLPARRAASHIEKIARFYAASRSVSGKSARLLAVDELDDGERAEYDRLHGELSLLHTSAPSSAGRKWRIRMEPGSVAHVISGTTAE